MTIQLLDEPTHVIAVAIVTELKRLEWPVDVTIRYVMVPELDAKDLGKETHVLIGGDPTDAERSSRGATTERGKIAFAVRGKCRHDDVERFMYLQSVAYTVSRQILQLPPASINATPIVVTTDISHDKDKLRSGEFITVRTAEVVTQRRIAS